MGAHTTEVGAGNRLMISLGVVVHPADRDVVATYDSGNFDIDGDVRTIAHQPRGCGEMRLMRPLGTRQAVVEQPLPDAANGVIVGEWAKG